VSIAGSLRRAWPSYPTAIEVGHKTGDVATLKKLAAALKVDLDHLAA
jgi:hypothetical protein